MATYRQDRPAGTYSPHSPMVRWGAILAGSVIGVGLLLLFSSLWVAWGQDVNAIADNIEWYVMGTAVVSLFVAGLLAGWLSASRGWGPGLAHGFTVWGLVLTVTLVVGAQQAVQTLDATAAVEELAQETDASLWAAFLGLAIGLVAAIIGGALGGSMPRPRSFFETFGDEYYARGREDVDVRESPMVEGTARTHVEQRQPQPETQGQVRQPQQPTTRRR
jgi:putative membrane protein (TIGR04086 family)